MRRGWLAYHVALLGRIDGKDFPELEDLTGQSPRERREPTPEDQLHAVRMWKALTKGR